MAKPGAWGLGNSGGKSKPAKQPPAAPPPAAPPPTAPAPTPDQLPQAPAAFTPLPISFKGVAQAKKDPTYTAVAAELGIKKLDDKKELQRVITALSARANGPGHTDSRPIPASPVFTPQQSNSLTPFLNPQTGGFGQGAYERARAAGLDPVQIASLLPASGVKAVGEAVQPLIGRDIQQGQASSLQRYQEELARSYEGKFEESLKEYRSGLDEAKNANNRLQSEIGTANAAREEARARAEAIEKQRKEEVELSASSQLSGLRSGSTVGGTPGAGLGSLTSGGSALSGRRSLGRGGAEQGGVLASYRRSIDPTDSVLDKGVIVNSMTRSDGAGSGRLEARRRALASGGGGSYYASRFG